LAQPLAVQPAKAICSSAMGEETQAPKGWDEGFPLTEAQRRAATHEGGPLIVLAGPGSGKTRTLIARAACLAAPASRGGKGVDPSSILAVTFTVKAAEQLRERLLQLLGFQTAERIRASTFHSFGRSIVRRFGDALDLPATLTVMDSAMRKEALREAMRQTDALADRAREGFDRLAQEMDDFITAAKRHALDAAACAEGLKTWRASIYADPEAAEAEDAAWRRCSARCAVYNAYEALTLARGWISLEDYMLLAVRILRSSEDARALVRSDIRHIIVDEFQDVNRSQIELLSLLAPQEDADICVVGDDDQAIYGFRGAEPQAFERFATRWPRHATIRLEANFRSAETIVRVSEHIVKKAQRRFAPEKRNRAATAEERRSVGAEPLADPRGAVQGVYVDAAADLGEAAALAALAEKRRRPDLPWSSIAVLARNSGNVERAQLALELRGVPCAVAHAAKPAEHRQVKTLIAWLRLAADPADEHHTQRALYEPPLAVEGERIVQWRRAWRSDGAKEPLAAYVQRRFADDPAVRRFAALLSELRDAAAVESAYELALRVVRSLGLGAGLAPTPAAGARAVRALTAALRFVRAMSARLEAPADIETFWRRYDDLDEHEQGFLLHGDERVDREAEEAESAQVDAVHALTAHKSKGLEFDTVIVVGVRPQAGSGFPASKRRDEEPPEALLPKGLVELADDADEERRLFYVACTRAVRSLTLIAKQLKQSEAGRSGDFFSELVDGVNLPVVHVNDLRQDMQQEAPDSLQRLVADDDQDRLRGLDALEREAHRARVRVAEAARAFESPQLDARSREAAQRAVLDALDELAVFSAARASESLPPILNALPRKRAAELRKRVKQAWKTRNEERVVKPLKPPLQLSYTRLRLFKDCPRCFYAQYVLQLREPVGPHMQIGKIVHEALQKHGEATLTAAEEGRDPPGLKDLLAVGETMTQRAGLEEEDRKQILHMLQTAFEMERRDEGAESASFTLQDVEKAIDFSIPWSSGIEHRIEAKIDRIDRCANGSFRIVDYKTGRPSSGKLSPRDDDMQLAVYAMALRALVGGPVEGVAEYWVLSTGERGSISLVDLDLLKVQEAIQEMIQKMLRGEFPRGREQRVGGCRGLCHILGPG